MYKGTFRSPVTVLLLSLVTCGIYHFYWIYTTSQDLQLYLNETDTSPALIVLLCIITCGIFGIYWYYKYGKFISQAQEKAGIPIEDNALLYVILAIFGLGIVNSLIIQSSLNSIWEKSI